MDRKIIDELLIIEDVLLEYDRKKILEEIANEPDKDRIIKEHNESLKFFLELTKNIKSETIVFENSSRSMRFGIRFKKTFFNIIKPYSFITTVKTIGILVLILGFNQHGVLITLIFVPYLFLTVLCSISGLIGCLTRDRKISKRLLDIDYSIKKLENLII